MEKKLLELLSSTISLERIRVNSLEMNRLEGNCSYTNYKASTDYAMKCMKEAGFSGKFSVNSQIPKNSSCAEVKNLLQYKKLYTLGEYLWLKSLTVAETIAVVMTALAEMISAAKRKKTQKRRLFLYTKEIEFFC